MESVADEAGVLVLGWVVDRGGRSKQETMAAGSFLVVVVIDSGGPLLGRKTKKFLSNKIKETQRIVVFKRMTGVARTSSGRARK
jgi:hypothetical protein